MLVLFFFLNMCVASVFSKKSIAGTTSKLRDAMEMVASRVDELGKSKIVHLPPQPSNPTPSTSQAKPRTRKTKSETAYADWDSKTYKGTEDSRRMDREQRRLAREKKQKAAEEELAKKVKALQTFDDDEEEETEAPEPDPPGPPAPEKPTRESVGVRNKRLELERRWADKAKRDEEKAKAAENLDPPKAKSPRQGKTSDKPTKNDEKSEDPKKGKGPEKSVPKQKRSDKGDDDAMNRKVASRTRGGTKASDDTTSRSVGKKSTAKHVEDKDYELDLKTGKFVKKKPVTRNDEDDDNDIEMEIDEIDDDDKDEDYNPDKELDQGDDEDNKEDDEDDEEDDFPIPQLRAKKTTSKPSDKSSRQKKESAKGKSDADEALADIADFVEEAFKKPARDLRSKGKKPAEHDACINPKEAARFRKAMKAETLELEEAVKKGTNVEKTYKTMIGHIVEACKDMKYDIPTDIEAKDIIPSIEDLSCKAWRLKMQGVETAGEGELNVSKTDNSGLCVAKKKFSIKDIMEYTEEVSNSWPDLKKKSFIMAMKKIMGNMTVAHRMVADASQELINLLDEIELPLWMKIADLTMRPLVHIEVPEVAVLCEEAKQLSRSNEQVWDQTTKITTIMESKSLPFLPTSWGYDKEGKAKKLIAGIVYKYVKDRMYGGQTETPATEVSRKFGINSTTMNRHILGKKYIGGKSSGSGTRRPVAQKVTTTRPVEKSKPTRVEPDDEEEQPDDDEEEEPRKKSKGSGKSSRKTRSAQEIRQESTSDAQKQKARKRKAEEAELDEELNADPDMPTPKQRAAALKALAAKGPSKGGVKLKQ